MDSGSWTPELPDRIGVYHAYVRGFNRDVRVHKMFFCCSGGLSKASDEFCNLVIDVGKHWTAHEVRREIELILQQVYAPLVATHEHLPHR